MTADDWKRRSVCGASMSVCVCVRGWDTHLEVLSDLADEALEGQLADEELCGLLVAPDLAEGDGSGAEAMGLLDTAGGGVGGLAGGALGGELWVASNQ
jgi:hypothetical protein